MCTTVNANTTAAVNTTKRTGKTAKLQRLTDADALAGPNKLRSASSRHLQAATRCAYTLGTQERRKLYITSRLESYNPHVIEPPECEGGVLPFPTIRARSGIILYVGVIHRGQQPPKLLTGPLNLAFIVLTLYDR